MSVDWGAPSKPRGESADNGQAVARAQIAAWEALASSFPAWSLEPPLLISRRPKDPS
jgi:hypothetical protein